jgi:hypothetical protein
MAYMFKGPASLTSGSIITNASEITTTTATINNASDNAVEIQDDINIGGDLSATTITATSVRANIREKVTTLTSVSINTSYGTIDVSNINILYFADTTRTTAVQLIATISWGTIRDGHRLLIAWTNRASSATPVPSVKVNFGASKLYTTGTSGPTYRYVTLSALGHSCTLYYSAVMNAWMVLESGGATHST